MSRGRKRKESATSKYSEETVKAKKETEVESSKCKYVVAIDFGTAFSGAAFAKFSDLESKHAYLSDAVQVHDTWPGQGAAGARPYCKTHTSAWYMPGSKRGTFDLRGWGWTGYVDYREQLQNAGLTVSEMTKSPVFEQPKGSGRIYSINSPRVSARCLHRRPQKYGYFLTKFKLGLAGDEQNLPDGLPLEQVISDYLRALSEYILQELGKKYGSDGVTHREIQYVLTVPAIWTDQARQTMKECAEMAGMVGGRACTNNSAASLFDLIMVTEPEAAAVHVHKTLDTAQFMNGDKFLVVDAGGGTTDIVLHEKIGSTTRGNIRVREVSASKGGLVGGAHVDERFFIFLASKIGCFEDFDIRHPRHFHEISRWWNDIKCSFNGDDRNSFIPIPGKLEVEWRRFDQATDHPLRSAYDSLTISSSELKSIFDPVVDQIASLIRQQLVPGLRAILIVGGFSESPYLSKRIKEDFDERTIFLPNGGSAVLRGAVSYGVAKEWSDMVSTRISPRTIGYDTSREFVKGKHREEYKVIDRSDRTKTEMCDNIFGIIVRRGEEVPVHHIHNVTLKPLYRAGTGDGDVIELNLYETRARNPVYVTDKGVKKLTTCSIPVPRKEVLGRDPRIQLSVHFGTLIQATVQGRNFSGKTINMPPVRMRWIPPNTSDPKTAK